MEPSYWAMLLTFIALQYALISCFIFIFYILLFLGSMWAQLEFKLTREEILTLFISVYLVLLVLPGF